MAIREGRWDCPTCGTEGIRGRVTTCQACGTPRPEGIRFYLPEDEPEVTDAELLRQAGAGADWICEHCGAGSRADQDDCAGCGAPRGSSPERETHEYDEDEVPRSGKPERRNAMAPPPSTKRGGMRRLVRWGIGAAAVAGVVAVVTPSKVAARVADKSWERTVQVERYRTVEEEGWSIPEGGREQRHWRALHHYRQVYDHTERRTREVSERVQTGTESYSCGKVDHGNGYFSDKTCTRAVYETRSHTETYDEPVYRQEPVYQTRYRYEIERWLPERVARAAGGIADEPVWPETRLGSRERDGERKEVYTLTFRDEKGKSYSKEVPRAQWDRYRRDEPATLKVFTDTRFEIVEPEAASTGRP